MTTKPIDDDTLRDLLDFAQKHGRRWRKELQHLWERGKISGRLYRLRNTHGPHWLWNFKPDQHRG